MVLGVGELSRGKLSLCFCLNPASALMGSALMPRMATPSLSNCLFASRNSDASMVPPGVLAWGKKERRTRWAAKSLSLISLPSSDSRRKAGALGATLSVQVPLSKMQRLGWWAQHAAPYKCLPFGYFRDELTLRFFGDPHRIASECQTLSRARKTKRPPSYSSHESSLRQISLTACGFAWPRVAFMTWPTEDLKTPSLPALNLATVSGFFAMTSRAACSMAAALTWALRPSAATMSPAERPH